MREDEFVLGVAVFKRFLQPQILLYTESPIPSVAGDFAILSFSTVTRALIVRPGHRVVVRIKDDEQGITPRPGKVFLPGQVVLIGGIACLYSNVVRQGILVAGIESGVRRIEHIRNRIREVFFPGPQAHNRQRFIGGREFIVPVPAFFILMISDRQEKRYGSTEIIQVWALNEIGRFCFSFRHSRTEGRRIHRSSVAVVDMEIGIVGRNIFHG